MSLFRLTFALLVLAISGCATSHSTLTSSDSSNFIYEISEEDASKISTSALHSVFGDVGITEINGSVHGFTTLMMSWSTLDSFKQNVFFQPVSGIDKNGRTVDGFYFEVSGKGSAFLQGSIKNKELYERVTQLADETGKKVSVSNVENRPYKIPTQLNRSEKSSPSSEDPSVRLAKLKELREKGLIDDIEYSKNRNKILEGL